MFARDQASPPILPARFPASRSGIGGLRIADHPACRLRIRSRPRGQGQDAMADEKRAVLSARPRRRRTREHASERSARRSVRQLRSVSDGHDGPLPVHPEKNRCRAGGPKGTSHRDGREWQGAMAGAYPSARTRALHAAAARHLADPGPKLACASDAPRAVGLWAGEPAARRPRDAKIARGAIEAFSSSAPIPRARRTSTTVFDEAARPPRGWPARLTTPSCSPLEPPRRRASGAMHGARHVRSRRLPNGLTPHRLRPGATAAGGAAWRGCRGLAPCQARRVTGAKRRMPSAVLPRCCLM
jgi:hypothetical protein